MDSLGALLEVLLKSYNSVYVSGNNYIGSVLKVCCHLCRFKPLPGLIVP